MMWIWIWFGVMILSSLVCAWAMTVGELLPFLRSYRQGQPKDLPDYELPYRKLMSWSAVVCLVSVGGVYLSGNGIVTDYLHAHHYPVIPYNGYSPGVMVILGIGLLCVIGRRFIVKRAQSVDPSSILHYQNFSRPVSYIIGLVGLLILNLGFLLRVFNVVG